jgi:hypothetical protein
VMRSVVGRLRRVGLAVLALVACAPIVGHTQAKDFILASADLPGVEADGVAHVNYGSFYLAGWAMDCATGARPDAVFVGLRRLTVAAGESAQWAPASIIPVGPIYRPDVAAAFGGACTGVTALSTGYALYLNPQPPPGLWRVFVVWANYDGSQTAQTLVVNIE